VNNLKSVDVEIPRNKLIVVTGLSGSGKSSLAFDTLYAEGQRRYVESLSAYARQFLGRMSKPEADRIAGLPPAIAIEQKVTTRNPRSTVGTSTEIYDYLRLLFSRVGRTFSPVSGCEVRKHSVDDVVAAASGLPDGTRLAVAAPIALPEGRDVATQLEVYRKEGFSRLVGRADGRFLQIADAEASLPEAGLGGYMLLVDRLAVDSSQPDEMSRLADSVETAFFEGNGHATLLVYGKDGVTPMEFSKCFEADGITFMEPNDQMFNFNSPYGACPRCEGFGRTLGIDERLVVPDPLLSVYDDAVVCWRGEKMSQWKQMLISVASKNDFPIHRPYCELTEKQKDFLW
ncbi:MAG: excinuclease ABC subunit A, partial [Paramuribaculum sp.]|nr:excinuclease ABC subunit A [Paramuribaculum sp.]